MKIKMFLLVYIISLIIVGGCSKGSSNDDMNQLQFSEHPDAVAIINNELIYDR